MLTALQSTDARADRAGYQKSLTVRTAEWLLGKVVAGRSGMFSEVVTVTPELAELLLKSNEGNRPVRASSVNKMVDEITGGRWQVNGEAVIVAKDGTLNDGQHRMQAVLECGMPIRTMMVFGADRESRFTVDSTAASRSAGDFLSMGDGVKNASICASVARLLLYIRHGRTSTGGGSARLTLAGTKTQIREEFLAHEKDIQRAASQCLHGVARKIGVSSLATAYVLIHRKNPIECDVFFSRVETGVGLTAGDPIAALRNAIMFGDRTHYTAPLRKVEFVVRHWNAWRTGKKITKALPIVGNIPTIVG